VCAVSVAPALVKAEVQDCLLEYLLEGA
jgi:hypothetical protein